MRENGVKKIRGRRWRSRDGTRPPSSWVWWFLFFGGFFTVWSDSQLPLWPWLCFFSVTACSLVLAQRKGPLSNLSITIQQRERDTHRKKALILQSASRMHTRPAGAFPFWTHSFNPNWIHHSSLEAPEKKDPNSHCLPHCLSLSS